jgi:hypothetical protein
MRNMNWVSLEGYCGLSYWTEVLECFMDNTTSNDLYCKSVASLVMTLQDHTGGTFLLIALHV